MSDRQPRHPRRLRNRLLGVGDVSTAPAVPPQVGLQTHRRWSATLKWHFEVVKELSTGLTIGGFRSAEGNFKLTIPDDPSLGCAGPQSISKSAGDAILDSMVLEVDAATRAVTIYPGVMPANLMNKCQFVPNPGWPTAAMNARWTAITNPAPLTFTCKKPSRTISLPGGTMTGWPEEATVGIGKLTATVKSSVSYTLESGCPAIIRAPSPTKEKPRPGGGLGGIS